MRAWAAFLELAHIIKPQGLRGHPSKPKRASGVITKGVRGLLCCLGLLDVGLLWNPALLNLLLRHTPARPFGEDRNIPTW